MKEEGGKGEERKGKRCRKGKEGKGEERKGKERRCREGEKGDERTGKERKRDAGKERRGKEKKRKERKGDAGKERRGKERTGKERQEMRSSSVEKKETKETKGNERKRKERKEIIKQYFAVSSPRLITPFLHTALTNMHYSPINMPHSPTDATSANIIFHLCTRPLPTCTLRLRTRPLPTCIFHPPEPRDAQYRPRGSRWQRH